MKTLPAIWLLGAVIPLLGARAQKPPAQLEPLNVEASRIPSDPSRTGASLTVLTAEDLAPFGNRPLGEILRQVPGVHFARSGPRGSLNTLSIRGNTQKYMLIRVDGVNVSDPSTSQVEPLVQHLMTADIERIEILRGSQSSLYGGQAVAGVVEITTKTGAEEGATARMSLEAGSFDTYRGAVSVTQAGEKGSLRASVERLDSEGFSAADEADGATEADGYENTTATLRGSYDLAQGITLKGLVRYAEFQTEFDGFTFGVGPTDAVGEETEGYLTQIMAGLTAERLEGRQVHDLQVTYFDMERDTSGLFPSLFSGDRLELDYVGSQEVSGSVVLLFGANGYEEGVDNGSGLKEDITIFGGFLQAEVTPQEKIVFSATGRVDDHSEFGTEATWRTTASARMTETTRLRGSAGSGFRAPALFELFDASYGNPELDPETSVGWDIGVDQSWSDETWMLGVTFFDLTIEDKIDFVFPQGYTTIEGESQTRGLEASLTGQLTEQTRLLASYTFISEAEDAAGNALLRVPEHDLSTSLIYSTGPWTVSGTASYISGVVDIDYSGLMPSSELPSYWVVNAFTSYEVNDRITLQARLENLLDETYQEVRGYGAAERSLYAGVEISL